MNFDLRFAAFLCVIALTSSCSWVKPSQISKSVSLSAPDAIVNCVKKGSTRSKTLSKFMFVPRSSSKVTTELVTLAKNEAVIIGGDTIVAESVLTKGSQVFGVYLCKNN